MMGWLKTAIRSGTCSESVNAVGLPGPPRRAHVNVSASRHRAAACPPGLGSALPRPPRSGVLRVRQDP